MTEVVGRPDVPLVVVDALEFSKPARERFVEWREGDVGCVHVTLAIWEDARDTLRTIGSWNRLLESNADLIGLARTEAEIRQISASGRTAVLFGFQNTSPFELDIEFVEVFHQLGVRIAQLTYNIQNHVGSGCWEAEDRGLSAHFGRGVVKEMQRVGMLVDLSHCGQRTCLDTIEFAERPVAVTHANPEEFVGTEIELNRRNKSTDLLKALSAKGGVIGLSMYPKIVPADFSLQQFCDMVAWTIDVVGPDGVGFGSDFYAGYDRSEIMWWRAGRWSRESAVPITPKGFSDWPTWFRSPADFPGLLQGLRQRGLGETTIRKVAGENWLRLFRESFDPRS